MKSWNIFKRLKNSILTVITVALLSFSTVYPSLSNAIDMPPQSTMRHTDNGVKIVTLTSGEKIFPLSNIASSNDTYEFYLDLNARAYITARHKVSLDQAKLEVGYQVGCQISLASGWEIAGGIDGKLYGHNNSNIKNDISAQVGVNGVNASANGYTQGGLDQFGDLVGGTQGMYRPGTIVNVPMEHITLRKMKYGYQSKVSLKRIHLKIDACGGPVKLRSYTLLRAEIPGQHLIIATYGKELKIKKFSKH